LITVYINKTIYFILDCWW